MTKPFISDLNLGFINVFFTSVVLIMNVPDDIDRRRSPHLHLKMESDLVSEITAVFNDPDSDVHMII
jgi:hypothetical protein